METRRANCLAASGPLHKQEVGRPLPACIDACDEVMDKLGRDREMPYESEVPFAKQEGATIVKMVAEDFVERVIENGAKSDVLVYFYFPGRRLPEFGGVVDSHARMRPKYHKLAQLIDPAASNVTR